MNRNLDHIRQEIENLPDTGTFLELRIILRYLLDEIEELRKQVA